MRGWSVCSGVTAAVLVSSQASHGLQTGQAPAPSAAAPGSSAAPTAFSGCFRSTSQTPGQAQGPAPGASCPRRSACPESQDDLAGGDQQFDLKIKGIEEKVNDLKEKIFRTKSRLLLLQETVLGGDISSSAKAVIFHVNEMSSAFVLERGLQPGRRLDLRQGRQRRRTWPTRNRSRSSTRLIVPGNHQISVRLNYRGHGYGIFSYLDGYRFRVEDGYTFSTEPGRVTVLRVVGFEGQASRPTSRTSSGDSLRDRSEQGEGDIPQGGSAPGSAGTGSPSSP